MEQELRKNAIKRYWKGESPKSISQIAWAGYKAFLAFRRYNGFYPDFRALA